MPKGVYERKPRTPEHCANLSAAHSDVKLSPEHCAAIKKGLKNSAAVKANAEAQRCVPRSPEDCAKISEGIRNSDAVKAHNESMRGVLLSPEHITSLENHWENMRGGNDLVTHHYIYDESDLSKNIVQMTRSDHMKLHKLLQKLGYIIPHINVKEMIKCYQ